MLSIVICIAVPTHLNSRETVTLKGPSNEIEWKACSTLQKQSFLAIKGSVSRELRHWLLYIIQKLFSRPVVALLKILILLKGQFAMYIKQFSVS